MTACTRSRTCSLRRIAETWVFTVVSLRKSFSASSAFERPLASSVRISFSRSVSSSSVRPCVRRRLLSEPRDETLGRGRAEERVPGRDDADRVHQLRRLDVLEEEAARAGADGGVDVLVEIERRQHEDARARPALDELPCRLDAVEVRHAHVHEDDVGVELARELERLHAVGRFAHELEVGPLLEHHAEAAAHERLVVDDENAGHSGNLAATRKPPVFSGPVSSEPPNAVTRSRIPMRPRPEPPPFPVPAPSSRTATSSSPSL